MTLASLLKAKAEIDAINHEYERRMLRFKKHRIKYRTLEALKKRREEQQAKFGNFVAPLIRQMPEQGLMEQLVAVQPMALPAGQLFYLDIVQDMPPLFGNMDDGLVRNAEELVRRRR